MGIYIISTQHLILMLLSALVAGLKKKDRRAQQLFFDKYRKQMASICRRYISSEPDAEEILMNAFSNAYRSMDLLQATSEGEIFKWLKTISVNECLKYLRKPGRHKIISYINPEEIDLPQEELSSLSVPEISAVIARLPEGYRTVFNLHIIEGYTHQQIAVLLNITVSTSQSQLSRSKQYLKKLLTTGGHCYAE
jgi:RNA polymerase sigma factor (sigma-70 family)